MKSKKILDFENNGVCIAIDGQFLYTGSKGAISKYHSNDMSLTAHTIINNPKKKNIYDGLYFKILHDYIFVSDFCDLHVLQKSDLQLLYTVRLGNDASSGVCGVLDFKFPKAYIKIRNGKIDILDIKTKKAARIEISDSSTWSNCITENRIYYSTTKGELFELERFTMREIRKVQLTKKMNIYSVVPYNNMLYTTSEKGFKIVDINTFEIVRNEPDVFYSTEAKIIGICRKAFVVVERKKVALFDTQTLQLIERFDFPTGYRHQRYAVLSGDILYGSDEHGIYCSALDTKK